MCPVELSQAEARRLALAAQGLHRRRRPLRRPDRRHLLGVVDCTKLLQLDSVNVLARAHYLPVWSRLGVYDRARLDALAYRDRELFEYWGHEASLLPVGLHPLLRWRMARARAGQTWGSVARLGRERDDLVACVRAAVAERGALRARDLSPGAAPRRGPWWDRSATKLALEWLFWAGELTTADRIGFERVYDLTERVLPAAVLDLPTPTEQEAHRELLVRAAAAHGVGTAADLADYFRLPIRRARARLDELVDDGGLVPAHVEGWSQRAYLHPRARIPRRAEAATLLAPFDPLVWARARVERLFAITYRIEIYVPAPRRRWGYYVLPFLLGDRLVARVDLKADRNGGVLRVPAAHAEADVDRDAVAVALAAELDAMADWLGLDAVVVGERGDLSAALRTATG